MSYFLPTCICVRSVFIYSCKVLLHVAFKTSSQVPRLLLWRQDEVCDRSLTVSVFKVSLVLRVRSVISLSVNEVELAVTYNVFGIVWRLTLINH